MWSLTFFVLFLLLFSVNRARSWVQMVLDAPTHAKLCGDSLRWTRSTCLAKVFHICFRTVSRCFQLPFFLYRINSCLFQSKVVRTRMKSEASKGRGCRPLWPCQARQNFCGCGQSSVPRQQSVCWRPILQFFCQWTFIPIPPECKAPLHRSLP